MDSSTYSGIVNAGCLPVYIDIDPELLRLCEDVLWNKSAEATEKLLEFAARSVNVATGGGAGDNQSNANDWRKLSVEERLVHSLVKVN